MFHRPFESLATSASHLVVLSPRDLVKSWRISLFGSSSSASLPDSLKARSETESETTVYDASVELLPPYML